MNQVNNEQRKPLAAEKRTSCYLSPVRISAISSSSFSCSHYSIDRIVVFDFRSSSTAWNSVKKQLLAILNPYFCELMKDHEDHERFVAAEPIPRVLTTSSIKYRIRLLHYVFNELLICYLTVCKKQRRRHSPTVNRIPLFLRLILRKRITLYLTFVKNQVTFQFACMGSKKKKTSTT